MEEEGMGIALDLDTLGDMEGGLSADVEVAEVLGGILDKVADTEAAAAAEVPGGHEPPPEMAGAAGDGDAAAHTAPVVVAPVVVSLQPVVPSPAEAASDAEMLSESGGALDVTLAPAAASGGGDAAGEGGGEEGDGDDDDEAVAADASLCAVDDDDTSSSLLPAQPPTSAPGGEQSRPEGDGLQARKTVVLEVCAESECITRAARHARVVPYAQPHAPINTRSPLHRCQRDVDVCMRVLRARVGLLCAGGGCQCLGTRVQTHTC
jgi:hypothetical protein